MESDQEMSGGNKMLITAVIAVVILVVAGVFVYIINTNEPTTTTTTTTQEEVMEDIKVTIEENNTIIIFEDEEGITTNCIMRKFYRADGTITQHCVKIDISDNTIDDDYLYCTKVGNMICPDSLECDREVEQRVGVCR